MATQLSIPSNIPKGTFFGDGLRAGPSYSSITSTQADSNGILIANDYNDFGPGILYSPQNTWNIVPYASTAANIVASAAVTTAKYLTFTQDTFATTLVLGQASNPISQVNNNLYVQFDWPRVPAVVVSGAAMSGPTNVTLFGEDWYGFPLQMTYVVNATGTYPANLGSAAKAFYRLTGVYVNGTTGVGGSLSVQTTNIFGLPYCTKEWSDVMNFSWDGNNMQSQYGVTAALAGAPGQVTVTTPAVVTGSPILYARKTTGGVLGTESITTITSRTSFVLRSTANDTSTYSWEIPQGGQNLFKVADTSVATGLTGDTRGLFQLPFTGETWANPPNGVRRAIVTVYSMGSDQFQNQLAAGANQVPSGGQPQGAGTVPPLTAADLYGVQQFYTGVAP